MSFDGNPFIYQANALADTDDTLRTSFTNDAISTISPALTLMEVQAQWMTMLEFDRKTYLIDSMSIDPGAAGKAKADQAVYEVDSTASDQQTSEWQSIIQAAHSMVDLDNNSRQANLSLLGTDLSVQHYAENLTMQGMKG